MPLTGSSTESPAQCPLCGSMDRKRFCTGKDRLLALTDEEFAYQRCRGCGVLYQSPRPTIQSIGRYYPTDNYHPYAPTAATASLMEANSTAHSGKKPQPRSSGKKKPPPPRTWQTRLRELCRKPAEFGDLLDFGCGSTAFLDQARQWGWRTHGTDFNSEVVARISTAGHTGWEHSEITREAAPRFDFIRLSHVVEHLYDPRATLRQLVSQLRPGGRMHVATPNGSAWSARFFRSCWLGLDCPRHIVIFSPETLKSLLFELGCEEVEVFFESKPADLRRSFVYFLGSLGLSKTKGGDMSPESPLDPLWRIPGKWSVAAGKSGRFHVFARKKQGTS